MDLTDLSKLTPGEFRGASRKLKCTYGAEVTLHGGPEWPRLAEKKLNSEKSVFLEALNGIVNMPGGDDLSKNKRQERYGNDFMRSFYEKLLNKMNDDTMMAQ
ncbi:hypothetical protein RB195_009685 [Necator americanus]|uniref:Uncharacterized protein n=1 Tax=Necator americanus TaxID=51031 RepID=A0ABR1CW97_NECAM